MPRSLKVGGVTPFTATDYPGQVAAVVFVQGCPWQCGYCHNTHLQPRLQKSPLQWSRVLGLLEKRVGLVDAVVFSGGEPTLDPALGNAMRDVRRLGFKIGLHTGGAYPHRLVELLPEIDWVALDVKAPFEQYEKITGVSDSGQQTLASAEAIIASGIDHEFRTTVHPALLSEDDVIELARSLSGMGVKNYALQVFRAQGCKTKELKATAIAGYPSADLVETLRQMFPGFVHRPA
ncbi:MAG TPA: anaerobic ribonucleoside-triphosphate reductase activating protein [Noviherbaspirillum sp.]|uniref:anaerobic ribonucleoside-triphosphate reductase activating protein n=1 Tax=Noviherbaspirillum sp. TaxID=1926288 RepID=UPI002B4757C3|nr:anaerobic ribonucleoside-triphosphate reductase activating protein [Noviherbaspirillum sp.]HJV85067.1 anaerobic ribonucleoside-triphosphate reductase activating protein [Noviherbaspirillum sp.]